MSHGSWRLNASQARYYRFSTLHSAEAEVSGDDGLSAEQRGYRDGLQQGQEQGQAEGYQQGFEQGQAAGRAQGEAEGFAAGQAQAQQQLEQLLTPLNALKQQLETAYAEQLAQQQQVIVALIQQVCDKVIRQELQLKPNRIVPLIEDTIATMPSGANHIEVRLHPSSQKALAAMPELADWHLLADPELQIGDLHISSEVSEADASAALRLQTCIDKLAEHLLRDAT